MEKFNLNFIRRILNSYTREKPITGLKFYINRKKDCFIFSLGIAEQAIKVVTNRALSIDFINILTPLNVEITITTNNDFVIGRVREARF